ncbi:MAG: hypothetical protein AAGG53_04105 [Cyanobacteria bacterium P01_H01_bin.152]
MLEHSYPSELEDKSALVKPDDLVCFNQQALMHLDPAITDDEAISNIVGFESPITTLVNLRSDSGELLILPTQYLEKLDSLKSPIAQHEIGLAECVYTGVRLCRIFQRLRKLWLR